MRMNKYRVVFILNDTIYHENIEAAWYSYNETELSFYITEDERDIEVHTFRNWLYVVYEGKRDA